MVLGTFHRRKLHATVKLLPGSDPAGNFEKTPSSNPLKPLEEQIEDRIILAWGDEAVTEKLFRSTKKTNFLSPQSWIKFGMTGSQVPILRWRVHGLIRSLLNKIQLKRKESLIDRGSKYLPLYKHLKQYPENNIYI